MSCIYDGKCWLVNVVDKNEHFEDVKVQFMHPSGPATSFAWPTREDTCWVPLAHVLMTIPVPTTNRRARQYKLPNKITEMIKKAFETHAQ